MSEQSEFSEMSIAELIHAMLVNFQQGRVDGRFGYVTKDEASAAAQVLAATGDVPLPTRMVLCTLCTAAASQALRDLADELDDVARIAKTKGKRLED